MKLTFLIALTLTCSFIEASNSKTHAKTWSCELFSKLPADYLGCEGESYSEVWTKKVLKSISLHKATTNGSPIISKLKKCEDTKSIQPMLKILRLGSAKVLIAEKIIVNTF